MTWRSGWGWGTKNTIMQTPQRFCMPFYYYHYYTKWNGQGLLEKGRGTTPIFNIVFSYNRTPQMGQGNIKAQGAEYSDKLPNLLQVNLNSFMLLWCLSVFSFPGQQWQGLMDGCQMGTGMLQKNTSKYKCQRNVSINKMAGATTASSHHWYDLFPPQPPSPPNHCKTTAETMSPWQWLDHRERVIETLYDLMMLLAGDEHSTVIGGVEWADFKKSRVWFTDLSIP